MTRGGVGSDIAWNYQPPLRKSRDSLATVLAIVVLAVIDSAPADTHSVCELQFTCGYSEWLPCWRPVAMTADRT